MLMTKQEVAEYLGCSRGKILYNIQNYGMDHSGVKLVHGKEVVLYSEDDVNAMLERAGKKKIYKGDVADLDIMTYSPRLVPKNMLPVSALWQRKFRM